MPPTVSSSYIPLPPPAVTPSRRRSTTTHLLALLYNNVIYPGWTFLHHHRTNTFVVVSLLTCICCWYNRRAAAFAVVMLLISNSWERYFTTKSRRMALDLRIFAWLTNIGLCIPLIIFHRSAAISSHMPGLIFLAGISAILECLIVIGFWWYRLRPWLLQLQPVYPQYIRLVHGDLEAASLGVVRMILQLGIFMSVTVLVGLDVQLPWGLDVHRALILRLHAFATIFLAMWVQMYPDLPILLRCVAISIACSTLYNMLIYSWEGMIVAVLPLAILAECLPEQLQALVDLIHAAPSPSQHERQSVNYNDVKVTRIDVKSAYNSTHHNMDEEKANHKPQHDQYTNGKPMVLTPAILATLNVPKLTTSQHLSNINTSIKRTSSSDSNSSQRSPHLHPLDGAHFAPENDFLWLNRVSFSKVETCLKYLLLAHICIFLPRPREWSAEAYSYQNLIPPNSPLWLKELGYVLYVLLPVVMMIDFRWQLRTWLKLLRVTPAG